MLARSPRPGQKCSTANVVGLVPPKDSSSSSGDTKSSSGKATSSSKADDDGAPAAAPIPDSTTLFRMSNPELLLDPNKRMHWLFVGGTIAFFAVYLSVTAYREGLFDGTSAEQVAKKQREKAEVVRELPDGRVLLRDGSIVRRPKAA